MKSSLQFNISVSLKLHTPIALIFPSFFREANVSIVSDIGIS